jgi:DNA (cytosine-5)-methyltransferase 1
MNFVLSLFHGIDIFGRGFESEGFCVVRAGEYELGFDVRDLHLPSGKFDGVIAGTPCQQYTTVNRSRKHQKNNPLCSCYGCQMLKEFCRLIDESQPTWFLLENVPAVPNIHVENYSIQRFDLRASECGLSQERLRHFQFGSLNNTKLIIDRQPRIVNCRQTVLGKETEAERPLSERCVLQGLPSDFLANSTIFTQKGKAKLIANSVAFPMAKTVAKAIREATCKAHSHFVNNRVESKFQNVNELDSVNKPGSITIQGFVNNRVAVCGCDCGRPITNHPTGRKRKYAEDSCRKRAELKRKQL